MPPFADKYRFSDVEPKWRESWKSGNALKWDQTLPAELDYVIDTPPPTVSGVLHIGHVYSYTQADIIARYFRMRGRNVLYPIGWDDNGLPTERLVEKIKKVRGSDLPRQDFVDLCRQVIPDYEDMFRELFDRLGLSVDWSREYQTIAKESQAISQLSFLDLYRKGILERRLEPTLWDPADRTAIAQAEVDEKAQTGEIHTIAFGLAGGDEVLIATTRPELIAACGALMIHPDHPRAGALVGQQAISPLYGVLVPIIADDTVDPEKGTGIVMCCTFGDVTDIRWWRTHKLPLRLVIDAGGRMRDQLAIGAEDWPSADVGTARATVAKLAGRTAKQARREILALLQDAGLVRAQQQVEQVIPVAERSGAPLEIIVTPQWFIRTLDFKAEILAKGREITWHPDFMRQRFESWVEGLKWDWSISRQRHFGVPLPVWYSKRPGEEGRILPASPDRLPVDPLRDLPEGYAADEVEPETDVMDTWATSSVSPQLVTRSIHRDAGYDPDAHERLFPMSMRPQAHEIIRTWAFYTIVKALHHQDAPPWRDICISGWCLAEDGSKMSKSKGNVVEPIKLLGEYGADPVRYWTGTSRLGNDTVLSANTLKQGKRTITKLWNAARLARLSIDTYEIAPTTPKGDVAAGTIAHPVDIWVLGQLTLTIERATAAFDDYEYAGALKIIEDFFWRIHCDNYLELVKSRSRVEPGEASADQISALHTLFHTTRAIIRLFAPYMPFITEELAENFRLPDEAGTTVHARGTWPTLDDNISPDSNRALGQCVLAALGATRKVKATLGVSMRKPVAKLIIAPGDTLPSEIDLPAVLNPALDDLRVTTSSQEIVFDALLDGMPAALASNGWLSVGLEFADEDGAG